MDSGLRPVIEMEVVNDLAVKTKENKNELLFFKQVSNDLLIYFTNLLSLFFNFSTRALIKNP